MTGFRVRQYFGKLIVPVITVSAALLLGEVVPALKNKATLFVFLGSVMISAWYGGFFSGLVATILSAGVTAYFRMSPVHSLLLSNTDEFIRSSDGDSLC